MRCPACGYVSFDYLESCKRCGRDLAQHKRERGIRTPKPFDRAQGRPLDAARDRPLSVEKPKPAFEKGSTEAPLPVSVEESLSPGAAFEPPLFEAEPPEFQISNLKTQNSNLKSQKIALQEPENLKSEISNLKSQIRGMTFLKGRSILGVDIGANAVKVVEVRPAKRGKPIVVNLGFQEIDIRRRRDGLPDREATLATLRDLLTEHEIKTKEAVVLLQGPSTAFLRLHLPRIPEKELQNAIRWEALKQVAFPIQGAVLSHQILEEIVDRDGLPKLAVLVAIADEKTALDQASLLKEAGLTPIGMILAPFALWQLIKLDPDAALAKLTVLLDLGAQVSTIAFFQKGRLQFAREVATAGAAITEALTAAVTTDRGRIQLDLYQAEKLKRKYGIPEEESRPLEEGISLGQLKAMMRPVLERLALEVQRSFTYFAERFGEVPIDRVLLSGGTAQLQGLIPFLAQRLGVRVELFNPFAYVELSPALSRNGREEVASRFATALGLALERVPRFNLLPASLKLERRLGRVKMGVHVLLLGLLLASAYWYAVEKSRVSSYQWALLKEQEAVASLRPLLETLRQLKEEEARLQPKLEAYKIVLRQGIPWPLLLKELSHLTSKAIALEELISQADGRLRIKGASFPDGEGAEGTLARYLSALAGSPFFHEVNLVATAEREGYTTRALEFEIVLSVK